MKALLFWLFNEWQGIFDPPSVKLYKIRLEYPLIAFLFFITSSFSPFVSASDIELKRTSSFGTHVDKEVKWEVVIPSGKSFSVKLQNLKDSSEVTPKIIGTSISHIFDKDKAGIYKLTINLLNADRTVVKDTSGKAISASYIQIVSPKQPPAFDTDFETKVSNRGCTESTAGTNYDPTKDYEVIVIDGTSAGIGAAVTAAKENGLKTCLLESSSLVGGMFTNGLGISDIGVDWQAGLNKPVSTGLLYGFMKDFADEVKKVTAARTSLSPTNTNPMKNVTPTTTKAEPESIDGGLVFRPSVAREAVYNLLNKNNVNVQIDSVFSSIEVDKDGIYTVIDTSGRRYRAKYIIDATDSGDVAVAYYMLKDVKTKETLLNESRESDYCKTLNNTDFATGTVNGLQDKPTEFPAKVPRFCVRNPPQAYSYIMTIHPYDNKNMNWSYMASPPPNCFNHQNYGATGIEGEYYTNMYTDTRGNAIWTFLTGGLGDNMYQVKHHSHLGTYLVSTFRDKYKSNSIISDINKADCGVKGSNFAKLGDELIDCNAHGTNIKTGYAVDSSVRTVVSERVVVHIIMI